MRQMELERIPGGDSEGLESVMGERRIWRGVSGRPRSDRGVIEGSEGGASITRRKRGQRGDGRWQKWAILYGGWVGLIYVGMACGTGGPPEAAPSQLPRG